MKDNTDSRIKPSKNKKGSLLLFAYGILAGTSTPLLLSRCAGSGGCGSCGGACSLAVGVIPLLLYFAVKSKMGGIRQQFNSMFRKIGRAVPGE